MTAANNTQLDSWPVTECNAVTNENISCNALLVVATNRPKPAITLWCLLLPRDRQVVNLEYLHSDLWSRTPMMFQYPFHDTVLISRRNIFIFWLKVLRSSSQPQLYYTLLHNLPCQSIAAAKGLQDPNTSEFGRHATTMWDEPLLELNNVCTDKYAIGGVEF